MKCPAKMNKKKIAQEYLEIWQWNCRNFQKKRHSLRQYIDQSHVNPDVICLQEAGPNVALLGYQVIIDKDNPRIATLINKDLTAIEHKLSSSELAHASLIEIIPNKRRKRSTFILNVYSPPRNKKETFTETFRETMKIANKNQLVIMGDFNAPHGEWGYNFNSRKGQNLIQAIENEDLTLITNPECPTRIGGQTSRDTCPDLAIIKNAEGVHWSNLEETLGSDHCIISSSIPTAMIRRTLGEAKITNWEKYRKRSSSLLEITNIKEWSKKLKQTYQDATIAVKRTNLEPNVDKHLLHIWDNKIGLSFVTP